MTLKPTNFRLETEILEALKYIRKRDGISLSEQARRALKHWIEAKGVTIKTERERATTRKRP